MFELISMSASECESLHMSVLVSVCAGMHVNIDKI